MLNDYSFSRRFMWSACPHCNFVSDSAGLSNPRALCQQCKQSGVRLMFPDPSHLYLLDMVAYFHQRATERAENLAGELVTAVKKEIGGKFTPNQLVAAARDLQQLLNKARTCQRAPDVSVVVERTWRRLNLSSPDDAQRIWTILALYSGTMEEHKVVPILSGTLLETMLDHLLETIGSTKAMDDQSYRAIVERVEHLMSFETRTDYFKELTGVSMQSAIVATPFSTFYDDWNKLRQDRNDFVHGFPFAVGESTATMAFRLTQDAPKLFAQLQNQYGIRRNTSP